jgi:hypothetical protein
MSTFLLKLQKLKVFFLREEMIVLLSSIGTRIEKRCIV